MDMHVCLIGNTGSGKTTLARSLCDILKMPLVSSGEVARTLAANDPSTDLALRQGALAPESSMRVAIKAEIEAAEVQHGGWILDGFPRSIEQLVCLTQWTTAMPVYLHVGVPSWVCIERLARRFRDHDTPDSIARRLRQYENDVIPMLNVLSGGGVLFTLDGNDTYTNVLDQAIARLS